MKKLRTIDVNKKVIVTNEYPGSLGRFNDSKSILNISAKDGDNTNGFVQAVFAFEADSQCCEYHGVVHDEEVFGEHFIDKIYVYENDDYALGVADTYGDEDFGELIVVIEPRYTHGDKMVWRCFNEHNGYYAHEVSVEVLEDGRKTFEYDTYY